MFAQTHWLIGNTISKIALQSIPGSINPLAFKTGCILPDFIAVKGITDHCKQDSLPGVLNMMENLQASTIPETSPKLHSFSLKLGIICHLITDFFCMPHNYKEVKPVLYKHLIYETELMNEFKKYNLEDVCKRQSLKKNTYLQTSLHYLNGYINMRHKIYLNQMPMMHHDVVFSTETAATVIMTILNNSLFNLRITKVA